MVVRQLLVRVVSFTITFAIATSISGYESPPGSESGLVSNFDSGEMTSEFGAGWANSTDTVLGGESSVLTEIVTPGAVDSDGALRVTGQLKTGIAHPFAGVMFSPGDNTYAPANLSSKLGISFFARGDGGTFVVMLFLQSRGFTPVGQTFEAGSKWARHTFLFEEFDGTDGRDLTGMFIGASGRTGPFEIEIDEVQFEAGGREVAAPPRIDNLVHPSDYETVPPGALGRIEIIGHGPTPLVLIPGFGHGGEIFRPFAEHNRDRYLMVLLTPPGVGGTPAPPMPDPPDSGYGERPWCRDYEHAIWEVIEQLHLESPILVGYSDGVQHAIRVALDHPKSVAGIISVIGEPLRTLPWPANEGTRVELVEKRMAHAWFRSVTADVWRSGMGSGSWYSTEPSTGKQLYEASLVPSIPTMVRYFCERWSYDPIPELEELHIPILAWLPDVKQLAEDANYQSFLTSAFIGPWESIPATSLLDKRVLPSARLGALVDLVEPVSAHVAEFVTIIHNRNNVSSRTSEATQIHNPQPPELPEWLTGSWINQRNNVVSEEIWTAPRGNSMFGVNRTIRDGHTVAFEFLQIVVREDGVYYLASPNGRYPPTPFKLTNHDNASVSFDNPEHDYPSRIHYKRNGDTLIASIHGQINGTDKSSSWTWTKLKHKELWYPVKDD